MSLFSNENLSSGVTVAGEKIQTSVHLVVSLSATSVNQTIFIAPVAYRITSIRESHGTAGGTGAAASLEVLTGTTANGSGTAVTGSSTLLTGTANTVQVVIPTAGTVVAAGARLGLVVTGTLTALANSCFEVVLTKV